MFKILHILPQWKSFQNNLARPCKQCGILKIWQNATLCVCSVYFILYVLQACACLFVLFISSLETNELWWLSSYLSFLEVTKDGSLSMRHLIQWMEVGNDPHLTYITLLLLQTECRRGRAIIIIVIDRSKNKTQPLSINPLPGKIQWVHSIFYLVRTHLRT